MALCLDGESSLLDYKSEQYSFDDDKSKSKFVKDVLAFANTYHRDDVAGRILIGVDETDRHTGEIVGVDNVLDGNIFQQLIDGKANKHIPLEVNVVEIDGKHIQIITIPSYNNDRPFYVKQQFGVAKPSEVYMRVGSSTVVATPEEIRQMGVVAATEVKPDLNVSMFSVTGILDDGKVHSFHLESDIDPSYGCRPFGIPQIGASHWDVYKWYQEEVGKLQFCISLANQTKVQADNVKVQVRIENPECGARIVLAPDWENHPSPNGFHSAIGTKKESVGSPRTLCPGEKCNRFETIHVEVGKTCEIHLAVSVFGRNLNPIVRHFSFQVVRHVVRIGVQDFFEIENNVKDEASYIELLPHLLSAVKTATDNSEETPKWEVTMGLYRRAMWSKIERRLGLADRIE